VSRIGTSPVRPDGLAKVAGEAVYADDFAMPGLLFGATKRSPHPHARIRRVRWLEDRAPEGAIVLSAADLEGPNGVRLINDDWPILADGVVRHVGEPVALVAARSRLDARRALECVEVEYEPLDVRLDPTDEAAEILCELSLGDPDVERALGTADLVVDGHYRTGHQEHIYIECQAMTAWFEEDGSVHVVGSMQCPYYVHKSLAHALGLEAGKVRVRASVVGGGFGGKEDFPSLIAIHAALLARRTGSPVRIAYDRHEDIVGTTKRHPSEVSIRAGVARDGTLEALDIRVVMDGGAYTTLSPVVLSRALLHACGPYRCPNVRVRGVVRRTNTAPNGAFRGFGAPQTQFAIERHMDRMARRVGLDPWEMRWRNALEPGDRLPTGQVLDESTSAKACLERVERETDFRRRWSEFEAAREVQRSGRGVGLSLYFHGAGFTGNGERRMRSPVTVRLDDAGRVEILTAMTDMGQGCAAIFPQIAGEAGGLSPTDIVLAEPDTARVPDSGPTVASRTTMIVGETIARAVGRLRDELLSWWRTASDLGGALEVVDSRVVEVDGEGDWAFREVALAYLKARGPIEITLRHEPPDWQTFDEETYSGSAYPAYAWGADVVEVEVEADTLQVRAEKATAVCEVGRVIHPALCAGQIEGGTLQSVAWALMEEMKLDGGRFLNDRLATYIIPTARDCPEIAVHLLEQPWDGGPFGAKGVGELPMDGGAPATCGAIENATGLAVDEIPATPERLYASRLADRTVMEPDDAS
jgi:CO/xanthine dehydrogenase Mo-binding subunit